MILHFCFLLCTLKLWLGFWDLFWFQELSTHTKRLLSPSRERIKDLKIVNFFQLFHLPSGLCNSKGRQPTHAHWPLSGLLERQRAFRILQYCIQHIYMLHTQFWTFFAMCKAGFLDYFGFWSSSDKVLSRGWPLLAGITDTWPHPTHSLSCAECTTPKKMLVNCQHSSNPNLHIYSLLQLYF